MREFQRARFGFIAEIPWKSLLDLNRHKRIQAHCFVKLLLLKMKLIRLLQRTGNFVHSISSDKAYLISGLYNTSEVDEISFKRKSSNPENYSYACEIQKRLHVTL